MDEKKIVREDEFGEEVRCPQCGGITRLPCPWCKGIGCRACYGKGYFECPKCQGRGMIPKDPENSHIPIFKVEITMLWCENQKRCQPIGWHLFYTFYFFFLLFKSNIIASELSNKYVESVTFIWIGSISPFESPQFKWFGSNLIFLCFFSTSTVPVLNLSKSYFFDFLGSLYLDSRKSTEP